MLQYKMCLKFQKATSNVQLTLNEKKTDIKVDCIKKFVD